MDLCIHFIDYSGQDDIFSTTAKNNQLLTFGDLTSSSGIGDNEAPENRSKFFKNDT